MLKRNSIQKFLKAYNPQILCLNETKLSESDVSLVRKKLSPYFNSMHFACCSKKKNYSGVAILYNTLPGQTKKEADDGNSEEEVKDETVIVGVA